MENVANSFNIFNNFINYTLKCFIGYDFIIISQKIIIIRVGMPMTIPIPRANSLGSIILSASGISSFH